MGLFGKRREGGFMDEIRCDEPSYLIWKWRPKGQANSTRRENAIRWGSSLRVREGSVAVFVNAIDDRRQDFIEGPFDGLLETGNLPVYASLIGLAYDGGTPFQAEVYFINLAQVIQVKFGVPFFDVFDPRFLDFAVPIAVRGTITFKIDDYRNFVKLHGLNDFDLRSFQQQIRGAVVRYTKGIVANAPSKHGIPVIQIESRILDINEIIEQEIKQRLERDFGVAVTATDIEAIEVNKQSEGFRKLMEVTRDITAASTQAKAQADIQNIADMQRINAENVEETLRIQREESQYAQRMQTRSRFIDTFRASSQAEVAKAGAEAIGNLGAHGGDSVEGGFSPAGIMAGMAMGGAVIKNMAGMMGDMVSGVTQHPTQEQTPPPIPNPLYNVVLNGQSAGPYTIEDLGQLVHSGTVTAQSFVWTKGMANWERAGTVPELNVIFTQNQGNTPPPIPPEAL